MPGGHGGEERRGNETEPLAMRWELISRGGASEWALLINYNWGGGGGGGKWGSEQHLKYSNTIAI